MVPKNFPQSVKIQPSYLEQKKNEALKARVVIFDVGVLYCCCFDIITVAVVEMLNVAFRNWEENNNGEWLLKAGYKFLPNNIFSAVQ